MQAVDLECVTPRSLEPCGENITVYYYDTKTQACLAGDFGACRYPNSYRTEEECERKCGAFRNLGESSILKIKLILFIIVFLSLNLKYRRVWFGS